MARGHAMTRADRSCASTCLGQAMDRERQHQGRAIGLDWALVRVNGCPKFKARGGRFNQSRVNEQGACEKRGGKRTRTTGPSACVSQRTNGGTGAVGPMEPARSSAGRRAGPSPA